MASFKENLKSFSKNIVVNLVVGALFFAVVFLALQYTMPDLSAKSLTILSAAALILLYVLLKIGSLILKLAIIIAIVAFIAMQFL